MTGSGVATAASDLFIQALIQDFASAARFWMSASSMTGSGVATVATTTAGALTVSTATSSLDTFAAISATRAS